MSYFHTTDKGERINYNKEPLRIGCNYCSNPATMKVSLPYMAAYMALNVCKEHELTAVEELYQYLPKDR